MVGGESGVSVWRVDVCRLDVCVRLQILLKVLSEELLRLRYACWGAKCKSEWRAGERWESRGKMGRRGSNGA